jgi:hypothetical protein
MQVIPTPIVTEITFFIPHPLIRKSKLDGGHALLNRTVQICMRDPKQNLWAIVVDGSGVLTSEGEVEYEPMPSSRDDEFLQRSRFTQNEALKRATAFLAQHEEFGTP